MNAITVTIPAARVAELAERCVKLRMSRANDYAELLRGNKIDWIAAYNSISDEERVLSHVCNVLVEVLRESDAPVPELRERVHHLRDAALHELAALQLNLRQTCVLNGPRSGA